MKKWCWYFLLAVLLGVTVWVIYSGRAEWLVLWLAALVGVRSGKKEDDYEKAKEKTDGSIGETKETIESIKDSRKKNDEEAKKVAETDYGSGDIIDLLHGANERERRRTYKDQS